MARLTISLSENLAEAAALRAAADRRSASSYVAMLIEADVRANAQPTGPEAELMAKLFAILRELPAPARDRYVQELEKVLSAASRQRRKVA